jgi:hypothetical protein
MGMGIPDQSFKSSTTATVASRAQVVVPTTSQTLTTIPSSTDSNLQNNISALPSHSIVHDTQCPENINVLTSRAQSYQLLSAAVANAASFPSPTSLPGNYFFQYHV